MHLEGPGEGEQSRGGGVIECVGHVRYECTKNQTISGTSFCFRFIARIASIALLDAVARSHNHVWRSDPRMEN